MTSTRADAHQVTPATPVEEWRQAALQVLPVWLLLVLAIAAIGTLAYQQAAHMRRQSAANDLQAQALLKARQIQHWLRERHDEAAWLSSEHQGNIIQAWLHTRQTQGPAYQELIRHFLPRAPLQQKRRYLLRAPEDGRILIELPAQPRLYAGTTPPGTRAQARLAMAAAASGQIQFDDLHHLADDPQLPIVLGLFIPIFEPLDSLETTEPSRLTPATPANSNNAATSATLPARRVLAVLQLSLSPDDFLYPLLGAWPAASASGETLLVRQEDDVLRYLNPLRGSPQPLMQTQRSLSHEPELIASHVLTRGGGFYEALDYRGVPSLAYGLPIAGTPWLLATKIDAREVFQPLHWIAALCASLLGLTLLLVGWWLSERRLGELRLQRALAAAEDLYQHAPCGYHSLDGEGRILNINDTELAMLGYTREEVLGRPMSDFMAPETAAVFQEKFPLYVTQQQSTEQHSFELLRRDGQALSVEISATALRDAQGRYLHSRTVVIDISARRALETRQQLLQRAIEASFDGFAVAQPDAAGLWRFVYCNPAFERMTGYSAAEIVGRTPEFLHGSNKDQDELRRLDQAVTAGQPYQGVLHNFRKDGTPFWNHVLLDPVHDEQGRLTHYVTIQEDVSSAREIQQRLEEKREQLRQLAQHHSQLLEAERRRIARELHDDLGQQLTALKMHINLLQMHYDVVPGLFEQADDMLQITSGMRATIRQAISQLRPAALDLGIISALEWLTEQHSLLSGIDCHYRGLTEEPPLDDTIATALLRTAQEAVNNATRHAQPRRIALHLYWCSAQTALEAAAVKWLPEQITPPSGGHAPSATAAQQQESSATRWLCLDICDDGCGFDPQQLGSGTHFGLLGMQERALAIGATLTIDSAPGRGSSVMIRVPLPINPSPAPNLTPAPPDTTSPP